LLDAIFCVTQEGKCSIILRLKKVYGFRTAFLFVTTKIFQCKIMECRIIILLTLLAMTQTIPFPSLRDTKCRGNPSFSYCGFIRNNIKCFL
jgi:hypothetical protein